MSVAAVPGVQLGTHAQRSEMTRGAVGPNAVIQLARALDGAGEGAKAAVFQHARLDHLLRELPREMVNEAIPQALFKALFELFAQDDAAAICEEAGRYTADYVIAHRIPALARRLLPLLPRTLATHALLSAIQRASWTFAGSGRCSITRRPPAIAIAANPLATPGCRWHVGVFERMFQTLVDPDTTVSLTHCCLSGDPDCRFAIEWRSADRRR